MRDGVVQFSVGTVLVFTGEISVFVFFVCTLLAEAGEAQLEIDEKDDVKHVSD